MMGLVFTKIKLGNPVEPQLAPIEVEALASTGAVHLCIPKHIQLQLGSQHNNSKQVKLADGSRQLVPYVGPIEVRFKNRVGYVGALV